MALSTQKQRKTTQWSLSLHCLPNKTFVLCLFCRQTRSAEQDTALMELKVGLDPALPFLRSCCQWCLGAASSCRVTAGWQLGQQLPVPCEPLLWGRGSCAPPAWGEFGAAVLLFPLCSGYRNTPRSLLGFFFTPLGWCEGSGEMRIPPAPAQLAACECPNWIKKL